MSHEWRVNAIRGSSTIHQGASVTSLGSTSSLPHCAKHCLWRMRDASQQEPIVRLETCRECRLDGSVVGVHLCACMRRTGRHEHTARAAGANDRMVLAAGSGVQEGGAGSTCEDSVGKGARRWLSEARSCAAAEMISRCVALRGSVRVCNRVAGRGGGAQSQRGRQGR